MYSCALHLVITTSQCRINVRYQNCGSLHDAVEDLDKPELEQIKNGRYGII